MKPFLIVFGLLALTDLALLASGHDALRWYTKPFLMPVLAVGVVVAARWRLDRARAALVLGLIASATGDTALLRSGDGAFVLGTLWFAMAQLCYIVAVANAGRGRGLVRRRPWLAIPYAGVWLAGTALLWQHLGALRVAVVPYSALLTAMAVCALDLFGRIVRRDALLVAAGAAMFVLSDSTLAFERFDAALAPPQAPLLVMLTYVIAQALIVSGLAGRREPAPPAAVRP
jgi:uncharacterized membrane protein YhhN